MCIRDSTCDLRNGRLKAVIHAVGDAVHIVARSEFSHRLECHGTVSYTHLDVYKRQLLDTQRYEVKHPLIEGIDSSFEQVDLI